jgi:hypothetical protein
MTKRASARRRRRPYRSSLPFTAVSSIAAPGMHHLRLWLSMVILMVFPDLG